MLKLGLLQKLFFFKKCWSTPTPSHFVSQ
jgi:hypothetical protein